MYKRQVRESALSKSLDRHANPHLQLPENAVQVNDDGTITVLDDGMVIPVPDDASRDAKYIVWEPHFAFHESGVLRAWHNILRNSRIAPILVIPDMRVPQLASGAALRRLAIPTVARIKELRAKVELGLREAIAGAVSLMQNAGQPVVNIDVETLQFNWPPALSSADEDVQDGNDSSNEDSAVEDGDEG